MSNVSHDPIDEAIAALDVPAECHDAAREMIRDAVAEWLNKRGFTICGAFVRQEMNMVNGTKSEVT